MALAEALRAYIDAAGIAEDRKGWLFRTARGHNGSVLSDKAMVQPDAWRMIRRRAAAAGIAAPIGCHTFRATGITAYLSCACSSAPPLAKWLHTKARARPSCTIAPRSGSRRTWWRGSDCEH
jgi:integrase